jgi:hypothetical protein
MTKIADDLGIANVTVSICLKRNKVKIRPKWESNTKERVYTCYDDEWRKRQSDTLKKAFKEGRAKVEKTTTPEQDEIMIKMYRDDFIPVPKIAKIMNINMHTIYLRLEEFGVDRRIIKGDFHPSWKGGSRKYTEYGSNWDTQRQKALKRDNHTCQSCGDNNKKLDVHHMKRITEYLTDKDKCEIGNDLENLITLCRYCHIIEHMKIKKVA